MRASTVLLTGLLLAGPALGQEATGRTWDRSAWVVVPGAPALVDVLVDARAGDRWWGVDAQGTVWETTDAGTSWRVVLGGAGSSLGADSGQEATLLNAEVRLGELMEDLDLGDVGSGDLVDLSGALGDGEDALREAVDLAVEELQVDTLGGDWFRQVDPTAPALAPTLHRLGAEVLVARADGLFAFTPGEGSVRRAARVVLSDVADLPGGGRLGVGPEGLWRTEDGGVWTPVEAGAPPSPAAIERVGDAVVAATAEGLWSTGDGLTWTRIPLSEGAWNTLSADPSTVGAFVAASPEGLWRFEAPGTAGTPGVAGPTGEVTALQLLGGGLGLVASAEEIWASSDGGLGWVPLSIGLDGAPVRALGGGGGAVIAATERGLVHLREVDATADGGAADTDELPTLEALRGAVEARYALWTDGARSGSGVQVLSWLLPQLHAEGRWARDRERDSSLGGGLGAGADGGWSVVVWATWTPPSRRVVATDPQDLLVVDDPSGGTAYAGGFDQWMVLGSSRRQAVEQRLETSARVVDLVGRRASLVRERAREGLSVRDQVTRELRIAEIDAWLDALTDGAVTRYRATRRGRGGEG